MWRGGKWHENETKDHSVNHRHGRKTTYNPHTHTHTHICARLSSHPGLRRDAVPNAPPESEDASFNEKADEEEEEPPTGAVGDLQRK